MRADHGLVSKVKLVQPPGKHSNGQRCRKRDPETRGANRTVMREFTLLLSLRVILWTATTVMVLASIVLLASMARGSH